MLRTSVNLPRYQEGTNYNNITALSSHFKENICATLSAFHALTGSEFMRSLYERPKISSLKKTSIKDRKCIFNVNDEF